MDLSIQARLLKVLEEQRFRRVGDVRERRVDIRLISATHHDIEAQVREEKFRDDLYYRIAAIPLRVPPLRERQEELVPLARSILARLTADLGRSEVQLSPEAASALSAHDWPGNIRELRNVLERALLAARTPVLDAGLLHLGKPHLARSETDGGADYPITATLEEVERRHIERVLKHHDGHVDRAAVALGMSRSTLYAKVKRYKLGTSHR